MKKIIFPLFLSLLLGTALFAFADINDIVVPTPKWTVWDLATKITNWFFGAVVTIAAIMLIYAGFTYVTSGGDPGKVKNSLNGVLYALLGVGIALLSKGLLYMVCMLVNAGGSCNWF